MDAGVPHIAEKSVNYGTVEQHIPSGPCRLSEDNVGDSLAPSELDQRVCNTSALQLHDLGSQLPTKSNIFLKHGVIVRIDSARFVAWGFDVDRKPV